MFNHSIFANYKCTLFRAVALILKCAKFLTVAVWQEFSRIVRLLLKVILWSRLSKWGAFYNANYCLWFVSFAGNYLTIEFSQRRAHVEEVVPSWGKQSPRKLADSAQISGKHNSILCFYKQERGKNTVWKLLRHLLFFL